MIFYIVLVSIAVLAWYYWKVNLRFKASGVSYITPVPLLGNTARIFFGLDHFSDGIFKVYQKFPHDRFVGYTEFTQPVIIVKDLELLKQLSVKDFDSFMDHRSTVSKESDPFLGRNLISIKGNSWKTMRSILSPAFTSSKIRLMVPFMIDVGTQMNQSIRQKIKDSGTDHLDLEMLDLTSHYANDVIASCAFGFKVDSFSDAEHEFYKMGKEITQFSFLILIKFFGLIVAPKLMNWLRIQLLPFRLTEYFNKLVLGVMKTREKNNIVRPDMIHLLMQAKKGKLSYDDKSPSKDTGFATVEESNIGRRAANFEWTDDDLVAQALLFFFAGFDTVSTAMTFLMYEMARHPEIQEKLAKEINDTDAKNGGKIDFETIQQMSYMDMVVSESLRMWPPAAATDRLCLDDYNVGKPNENSSKDFIVKKGEAVYFPIRAIHHDPQYWPEPDKFIPERFDESNRDSIKPFTYMPFGLGPRNCIGSRFALCEIKVMLYQLLKEFEVCPYEKTVIPPKLSKTSVAIRLEGGAWIRFKIRQPLIST